MTSILVFFCGFINAIITSLFMLVFSWILGVRRSAMVSAVGIILYTLQVGANRVIVQATSLGILTLLGYQLGRRQTGLNSLVFVAAVMAVITPAVLWDYFFCPD